MAWLKVAPVLASLFLPVLAFQACRLRTSPAVAVAIRVSRLDAPDTLTDATGNLHKVCLARLNALAVGDGAARWMDATWRWYDPADTTVALDSAVIPPGTVQRNWGAADISSDEPRRSQWQLSGRIPFVIRMEYRYLPDGGDGPASTTVTLRCAERPAA